MFHIFLAFIWGSNIYGIKIAPYGTAQLVECIVILKNIVPQCVKRMYKMYKVETSVGKTFQMLH